ncbi:MAG TPA: ankyrin repeat domain-containing protein [Gammaproteobacteria bacterium]|jgi:ankyrin repeat protein|nr:ankyrin repeat domain-containing protein [Gammaproteobacteria bacterium]
MQRSEIEQAKTRSLVLAAIQHDTTEYLANLEHTIEADYLENLRHPIKIVETMGLENINSYLPETPGLNLLHTAVLRDTKQAVDFLVKRCNALTDKPDSNGHLPLYLAAARGENDIIHPLLHSASHTYTYEPGTRESTDILAFSNGKSALYAALENGHLHTARLLIEKGADPDRIAINELYPSTIEALATRLLADGKIDITKYQEMICLLATTAISMGDFPRFRDVLADGFREKAGLLTIHTPLPGNGGLSLIHLAARDAPLFSSTATMVDDPPTTTMIMDHLVQTYSANINLQAKVSDGIVTPLWLACHRLVRHPREGDGLGIAKYLLIDTAVLLMAHGARPDQMIAADSNLLEEDREIMRLAASLLAQNNNLIHLMDSLLSNDGLRRMGMSTIDAPLNIKDNIGFNLLHIAAESGATYAADLLIGKYKAQIDSLTEIDPNNSKKPVRATPLWLAVLRKKEEMAESLLRARADLKLHPTTGEPVIFVATAFENAAMIELLLKYGADPNQLTHCPRRLADHHRLPLCEAVLTKNPATVAALLKSPTINTAARDRNGFTALDHARRKKLREIIALLTERGAGNPEQAIAPSSRVDPAIAAALLRQRQAEDSNRRDENPCPPPSCSSP